MASIAEQVELLPQVVSDTRTTNYLTLAAFMILLYDMILTFPSELELIWKARWTSGSLLFILNRYPVFLVSLFLLFYMFDYGSPYHFCVVSNYVEAWSMLIFVIPVQVVLILRTLALWEQSNKIRLFLYGALLAVDTTIIVSLSLVTKSLSFENRPFVKPVLGCYGTLESVSTSHAIPSWIALIAFDTIVFLLTVIRVEGIRRAKKDQSLLLHILFRDGIVFYVIMLASSVANLALYASLPLRRRGLIISLIPLLRTVMSVCTARLLLNLREVAVDHGRSAAHHWALGELEVDRMSSSASRTAATTSSSSTSRHSLNGFRGLQQHKKGTDDPADVDDSHARTGRRGILVSVEEEEYRDSGDAIVSPPSSFRSSVLNRFTNITNTNMNIELGELRSNNQL